MRVLILLALCACATSSTGVRPAPTPTTAPDPVTPAEPARGETPTQVLPGDSAGPVNAGTSHDDLLERLGEDALTERSIDLGEGVTATATVVYAGTERELQVVWQDDSRQAPESVRIIGGAWQLPEQLHVGDRLDDLRDRLGEVSFLGFGWDGGGTVVLDGTALEKHADHLYMRLHATGPLADALMGDQPIAADHPQAQAAGLVLQDVRIRFR